MSRPQSRSKPCEHCGTVFHFGSNEPNRRFCKKGCASAARYAGRMAHNRSGYNRGCRCEVCVEANRAYGRRWQQGATPRVEGHGTVANYRRGCRCDECHEARQLYRRFMIPLSLGEMRGGRLFSTIVVAPDVNAHLVEWSDPTADEVLATMTKSDRDDPDLWDLLAYEESLS